MNLPPLNIPSLLRRAQFTPKKSLGQNFLLDPIALEKIKEAAEIPSQGTVLEIGAGLGSLTRVLASTTKRVIAIEIDQYIIPLLNEVISPFSNVEVIHGDILEIDPETLTLEPGYLVVANIPYYITSAVIRHLLEAKCKPERLVLTIQREVAQRICATPGDLSLLALSVQVYGAPKITTRIPAGAFYPAPTVDSAVIRIDLYPQPLIDEPDLEDFFTLTKAAFHQKRKTLRNSLSNGLRMPATRVEEMLLAAKIDPQRRGETLSIPEWKALVAEFRVKK